ncbi:DUF4382 domain-containing protein [Vibrio sp. SCSIO 43140]|uniref:DUF4382 domain-containing protein n=1 Tax=Vibrio sp. SCSIO 43140 TaxID=2819100 RepID=UPI002075B52B|nr:DUF4382 domain-containing protein [Vibrio sp. SCSIO 43140]USD61782.1 DUF4382 domain-containing protein [Vibrio sp. SCSIO 43140]
MKTLQISAIAGLVSLALVSCGGDSGSGASTTAPLTLSVTDAPVDDVKEVVVTFGKVALLSQGGDAPRVFDVYLTDDEGNPVDEEGNPIPDGEDPVPISVNLLDYQGDNVMPLLEDEIVNVGEYQMCVFANDGDHPTHPSYVIKDDPDSDDELTLELTVKGEGTCPQGVGREPNAGVLFFNKSFTINQQTNNYAIEFDLRRGLKNQSTFPNYTIQRTSITLINTAETGNIKGTITADKFTSCNDPLSDAAVQSVYLYESGTTLENMAPIGGTDLVKPITSASVGDKNAQDVYEFAFGFLDAGSYNLGYTCTAQHDDGEEDSDPVAAGFTIYDVITDVSVVVNEDTNVEF